MSDKKWNSDRIEKVLEGCNTPTQPGTESRVVIIDDHLTPYRQPIFEGLARSIPKLTVLFCAANLRHHAWDLDPDEKFDHKFLPGFALKLKRPPYGDPRIVLINPTLLIHLIRARPEVVVGYAFSVPAWTAFLYSKISGARYVCWSTDTLHTERHLGPLQRISRRLIIRGADFFVTASLAGVDKFQSYGVPLDRIETVTQRTLTVPLTLRSDAAQDRGEVTALYVGALSRRKGLDRLLRALASISGERRQWTLVLVGDGPEREELTHLAADLGIRSRVRFEGFVQPGKLPAYYSNADLFVFPTLEDTFGVALADAVAAGLPALASVYAGATGDYVEDGTNGITVDPHHYEHLARALDTLIDDRERLRQMGAESLRIAEKHSISQAIDNFLSAILNANPHPGWDRMGKSSGA